jgi:cold-inducible RNA-binding protein
MKIYVGNLSWGTAQADLETQFSEFGEVQSAAVITDRETGRSRGFGFVEMNQADGAKAIEALNGQDVDGRELRVNEAHDKPKGGGGGGDRW